MDLRWQDVRLFYAREVRAALRERSVVLNSILIPILLYPVMLWLIFLAITFAQGQEERFVSRIAWSGEARPERLTEEISGKKRGGAAKAEEAEKVEWRESGGEAADREAILAEELDLAVRAESDPAFAGNLRLFLLYDASKERSAKARERLLEAARGFRGAILESEAGQRALPPEAWKQVHLQRENVSTAREMGAFLLGLLGPIMMVMMIAVGSVYPAVDATAGERERSTWETTFTTSASRASILLAKYLYVASFGLIAGLLNLVAMAVSMPMIFGMMLEGGDERVGLAIPWSGLPLVVLAASLLALSIAAAMMILAAFARTFKEGQAMIGPVYFAAILPTMVVSSPDLQLSAGWSLVPIANLMLLFRDAIRGVFQWPLIGVTLLVQLALVFVCLYVARQIIKFEDVITGSYGGNFQKFLKERVLRPGSGPRAAKEPGA